MLTTRWPASSRVFRSVPKSLTEFAPLTPESASSTLSRISCEKLKLMPGNSLELLHQLVLDLLAGDRPVPESTPRGHRLVRHSSIGLSGTLNSRLKKLVTSVPSSGRPMCDITPRTSGTDAITSRSRGAIRAASSSETVRGRSARIQRFPPRAAA